MVNIKSIPLHYLHYCIMVAKTAFTVLLAEKSKCNHNATVCIICIIIKSYFIKIISYLWVMANKAGRPPMFSDPEELQRKVEEYFVYIQGESDTRYKVDSDDEGNPSDEEDVYWIREPEPPTITGLCLFLGFDSRQSFYDYGSIKEFSYTIKRARLMIESEYEKNAQFARTPAFHIFALKNLGWSDRVEVDNRSSDGSMTPVINIIKPKNE